MAKIKTLAQKLIPWRIWVQISFLAVWLDPLALRYHNVCAPVFNCYACPLSTFACPIGVIHQFSALHVFPFITVGFLVLFGVLFGGFICGWICPIGLLQDLFSRLRTPKFQLPTWTGYLSYITLIALVLVIPYLYGVEHFLAICQVCPVGALVRKREGFTVPIGSRRFDDAPIGSDIEAGGADESVRQEE